MDVSVYMPTRLMTGKDCVKTRGTDMGKLGRACLIVTGGHSARICGALADAESALESAQVRWKVFDGVGANPTLGSCMEAAALAVEMKADFILGIGGGSPLDAAKCTAVLAANPGMTQEELYSLKWNNEPLPVATIGTTAGTGSEVTSVSVITVADGRKKSFRHDTLYPALSFGDPSYTMTMPEQFTRSTAVDAFAHCMESYFCRTANELSQAYAVRGAQLLVKLFRDIKVSGCGSLGYSERECCYNASIYGGLAINITGTAFPHTMGYLLTEHYGVPHGTACAVFLPDFYNYNKEAVPELTARFLAAIGCAEEELLSLLHAVTPDCAVSISTEEIAAAHGRWIGNDSIAKCQGDFTADRADEILQRLFCACKRDD